MQGPVGSRCRQCGKPAFDPLTSFTPGQLALGIATAVVGGLVGGYVGERIGFFSIIVSYVAGGFVADLVLRATGYKRGPVLLAIVFGGLTVGILAGSVGGFLVDYGTFLDTAARAAAEEDGFSLQPLILDAATWAVISVVAACAGAWSRLRFLA